MKDSLKRRKEIAIQIKKYFYEEVGTEGLFEPINHNDKASTELLERNKILNQEIRAWKREDEIQLVRLCEVTKWRKKVEEDRTMVEEEKRIMDTKLEESVENIQE